MTIPLIRNHLQCTIQYNNSSIWFHSTVLPWIVAGAIINFEGNFARKYFVNFWEYKYFWESNCSSRSVIEMMRHFDMKC